MRLSFLGHAAFLLETQGKQLLLDPFISPNPLVAQALEADASKAALLDPKNLNPDYILLTHGHQDHVADAEQIAGRSGAPIISNYEIVSWYGAMGLKGHPLNHGGAAQFEFGTAKYVQAVHSSVLPDGTYGGNPGGFVISNEEGCVYLAGDTALTWDMKLIPMSCPKLDFAILPIGDNFTMGYQDALIASDFIQCDRIVGCHYDTFGYIEIDHNAAQKAFEEKGKKLILMEIGETIDL